MAPNGCGIVAVVLTVALAATPAGAQSAALANDRPAPVVEGALGWAGFVDDSVIHHTLAGVGGRYYVNPYISLGPELQVMVGPGQDRDVVLTGNFVVDVLPSTASRPRRTTPYVVLGGGLFHHSNQFGGSTEAAFTAGPGVRVWLSDQAFVAADARIGWEPHLRLAAVVGVVLR